MLVQNNYLLAKNERTLTLQTYWIRTACLQAMSGVIQFCLRRTIYYERWVKKASSLIAHQNHYRSAEGAWAVSGRTRQSWSRLPGDQIQFALRAAVELRAISQGQGRLPREHRTANCLCLAWQPSASWGGGWLAWSATGWIFLHWQNPTSHPQRENPMFKVQYIFTPLAPPRYSIIVWRWRFSATSWDRVKSQLRLKWTHQQNQQCFRGVKKPKRQPPSPRIHFCWKINMWSFATSLPQHQWESFQWLLITLNQAPFFKWRSCSYKLFRGSSALKGAVVYYIPEHSCLIYGTNWTCKINQCFPVLKGYTLPNVAWC